MKTLFLLRHAKSSWDDPDLPDHDRPLAPRGERAAQRISAHIRRERIRPDLVLCSSAVRARRTLEIVAPALGDAVPVRIEDELYGVEAEDLLHRLRQVPHDVDAVMVLGHNPGLQELAVALAGEGDTGALRQLNEKFPTGALATLTTAGHWGELGTRTTWLESLIVPRDLGRRGNRPVATRPRPS
jgi:phosphohistidine phosphatase